jgi:hypothetical protein
MRCAEDSHCERGARQALKQMMQALQAMGLRDVGKPRGMPARSQHIAQFVRPWHNGHSVT